MQRELTIEASKCMGSAYHMLSSAHGFQIASEIGLDGVHISAARRPPVQVPRAHPRPSVASAVYAGLRLGSGMALV